jgi:hypothetical protein
MVPIVAGGAKKISKWSYRAGRFRARSEARIGSPTTIAVFACGATMGIAGMYLLDPQHGKRRRHLLRDRVMARMRRAAREGERKARYSAGKARGAVADARSPGRESSELNDPALAAKVESELFRAPDAPKATVDVNVERGVVYLRGEVASEEQLQDLIQRAQRIAGVVRAESLLHLPGQPASHKT